MSKPSSKSKSTARPASSKRRVAPFSYGAIGGELRPVLPIIVHTAHSHIPFRALVDSGADYSIIPASYATILGVDLDKCRDEPCRTAAGAGTIKIHDTPFEGEVQAMRIRFAMKAAFNEHASVVLLGREDFFKAFKVAFDHRALAFTLESYDFPPATPAERTI